MGFPYTFPFTFPDEEEDTVSVSQMVERLAQYLKDKPNVLTFLTVFANEVTTITQALADLKAERTVDDAFGAQLDVLGAIVGEARQGKDDDTFRNFVKARIILNSASGTIEELYSLFGQVSPGGATLELVDQPTAGFALRVFDVVFTDDTFEALAVFLRLAHAGGVRGVLEGMFATRANSFRLDGSGAQGLDSGIFVTAIV